VRENRNIKHASRHKNKEQKEAESQGPGGFWMYTHRD